jgi:hypothetical protein
MQRKNTTCHEALPDSVAEQSVHVKRPNGKTGLFIDAVPRIKFIDGRKHGVWGPAIMKGGRSHQYAHVK